jgi:hypothetical protein
MKTTKMKKKRRAAATGARRGLTRSRGAGDDDHDD